MGVREGWSKDNGKGVVKLRASRYTRCAARAGPGMDSTRVHSHGKDPAWTLREYTHTGRTRPMDHRHRNQPSPLLPKEAPPQPLPHRSRPLARCEGLLALTPGACEGACLLALRTAAPPPVAAAPASPT